MQPVQRQTFLGQRAFFRIEQAGQLSRQTAGGANQPFGVGSQIVGVDARLVVIAVELRVGAYLEQVAVAGLVLSQQQQVVATLVVHRVAACHWPAPAGQVRLDADHRANAGRAAGAEEGNHPVHGAMVGQGQRGLSQRLGALDQLVYPAEAIKQRVF